ncbi:SRPBCC domain-containing protein [Kangiella marina]|uniref:SRPBCC family protein n=1 Tax=Kangiella marina TaxID=1079178 RepID=A0ABP8IDR4_9GAMM
MKIILMLMSSAMILLTSLSADAIVSAQSKQHFMVKIETTIKAPAEEVYQQFINIGDWWESSHTWFGDASKMYIEPKANGCFCEVNGEQEALHMTVSMIMPNKNVQMVGGLGPLQSMAVYGHMSWSFKEPTKGLTTLTMTYLVKGFVGEESEMMAKAVDGVLAIQINNLKSTFK